MSTEQLKVNIICSYEEECVRHDLVVKPEYICHLCGGEVWKTKSHFIFVFEKIIIACIRIDERTLYSWTQKLAWCDDVMHFSVQAFAEWCADTQFPLIDEYYYQPI